MITQLLLLSTCGTSVLTNQSDQETRLWLTKIANDKTLAGPDAKRLQDYVAKCKDRLCNADADECRSLSTELNGIGAVLTRWPSRRVQHLLIHTDTATGLAAAEVVAATIEKNGEQVQLLTAGGLRTDHFPAFRDALAELTVEIEKWIATPRQGWTTVFNLTGGFKSVSAYLQAIGMLYADRCVFLFEGAPALMEIPRLPVRFAEADEIRPYLLVFRRLAHRYPVAERQIADVPDSLLLVDDGQATTSVWGEAVWKRVRAKLLAEAVLDPLSPKLTVENAVHKTFSDMQEDLRLQVNEALDALSAYLDLGRELPKSNTLKKLEGKPASLSTHELYVSSDGPAWRLFGHFDAGRFLVDSLGTHL